MAYSSINQMGFLLMGLTCGTFEGLRATLIYLLIYIIMNIGFFILIIMLFYIQINLIKLLFKIYLYYMKMIYLFMGALLVFFLLINTQFFMLYNILTKSCLYPLL